ncbi:MAG: hypothetical protein K2O57_08720, partial [Acetatifactor sp.]|nr:hypothetical protein [Acetatifactor sp.]
SKIPNTDYERTTLNAPMSLDMYDVNIIDLNHTGLWEYRGTDTKSINDISDLRSINMMLSRAKHAVTIIVLPGNLPYRYCYDRGYMHNVQLKDMLGSLQSILKAMVPSIAQFPLLYENNISTISGMQYGASFYFDIDEEDAEAVQTYSDGSHKPNTVTIDKRMLATTLDILDSEQKLNTYLQYLGLLPDERSKYPDWLKAYVFGDDNEQRELIRDKKSEIEKAEADIARAEQKLAENLAYKSILYTNGGELVGDVFDILEQILDCDLSGFVDKLKEDFLIKLEGVTLIGEIKGVTSNVKSEHVSQLETHYYGYMDALEEKGESEQVKQLLIISPFRTKPLEQREPIHENQIKLAERNNALIIETRVLLSIFEKFQKGELDAGAIRDKIISASGLLRIEDFA